MWVHGDASCCVKVRVGPDHTRMTMLERRSYLWLCFENWPVAPHGGPHVHASGGQTLPAVDAFLHDQPGVNCFALGSRQQTRNVLLLFFSALFLAGGDLRQQSFSMNKKLLHNE